jgi:Tol biopolymer transport system component
MPYFARILSLIFLLPAGPTSEVGYECSAGGGQLAFSAGGLKLLDTATGEVTILAEEGDSIIDGVMWSPDGTRIAFSTNQSGSWGIYMVEVSQSGERVGQPKALFDSPDADEARPLWSPDGTQVAFVMDGSLYVANADDAAQRITVEQQFSWNFVWTPDSRQLVYSLRTETGWVVQSSGRQGKRVLTNGEGLVYFGDSSPDGMLLMAVSGLSGGVGRLFLLDTASGELINLDFRGSSLIWSPDGAQMAFIPHVSDPFGDREIVVMAFNGANQRVVNGEFHHHIWGGMHWSPDGRHIAFSILDEDYDANGVIHTLDLESQEVRAFHEATLSDSRPQWRPCVVL